MGGVFALQRDPDGNLNGVASRTQVVRPFRQDLGLFGEDRGRRRHGSRAPNFDGLNETGRRA